MVGMNQLLAASDAVDIIPALVPCRLPRPPIQPAVLPALLPPADPSLVEVVPPRFALVLQRFSAWCEIYSIDEAFLRIPADSAVRIARVIRETVQIELGLPVSVGIGKSKTLAKLANRGAKTSPRHDGVMDTSRLSERVCGERFCPPCRCPTSGASAPG